MCNSNIYIVYLRLSLHYNSILLRLNLVGKVALSYNEHATRLGLNGSVKVPTSCTGAILKYEQFIFAYMKYFSMCIHSRTYVYEDA